jgi:serine/threonine protein kinase
MGLPTLFSIELAVPCWLNVYMLDWMQIKREISTMKLIKHPNVVRIYEVTFLVILQSSWSEENQVIIFPSIIT